MDRRVRARNLLIELESLAQPNESTVNLFTLLNEVLRDAKALAEETINEQETDKEVA